MRQAERERRDTESRKLLGGQTEGVGGEGAMEEVLFRSRPKA